MNDFFLRQDNARRTTHRLLLLFALAVIAVVLAIYLLAAAVRVWTLDPGDRLGLWHPPLFFWSTTATLACIAAASFWKMRQLGGGGGYVAMTLGAKPVPPQTQDPRERMLRNVVEEMAIASGVPVPDLYLLEQERGINALAAGHDARDAVICVTRGALELLSRDELQGVIAHEFSHILNGDVLLNLRLLGWLNGIQVVGNTGYGLLRGMRRARGQGAVLFFAVALALIVIGYLGYFFGQLIKSAVSRQREYLGDASAVQFTRNPDGLSGALKKIGGLATGSRLATPRAVEVSHMFFGNGLEEAWLHALDSHPPLDERIRRLEPRFSGVYPAVTPLPAPEQPVYVPKRKAPSTPEQAISGAAVIGLLNSVGEPMQQHLDLASRLLAELPDPIVAASRDPLGACAMVYGLLLDPDDGIRRRQEMLVEEHHGAPMAEELRGLAPALRGVGAELRLPLLDLSLPALRALSPDQFQRLKKTSQVLSAADGKLNIFEFTLRYLLLRHLEPRFSASAPRPAQIFGVRGVQKECSCILSTLARIGHRDEDLAREAFAKALLILSEPKAEFDFLPAAGCGAGAMEKSFASLEMASPLIKRKLLAACLECLSHDQVVTPQEVELFRAVADAMGCPVPPWLDLCRVLTREGER